MTRKTLYVGVLLLVAGTALAGCLITDGLGAAELKTLADIDSVASAIANAGDVAVEPPEIQEVTTEVYGRIESFGAFFCPCFELSSEGETILVRHGLFAEGGYEDVDVEGFENGDWVIVSGVLRLSNGLPTELWATSITRID